MNDPRPLVIFGPTPSRDLAEGLAGYLDGYTVLSVDVVVDDPSEPAGPTRRYCVTARTDDVHAATAADAIPRLRASTLAFLAGYRAAAGHEIEAAETRLRSRKVAASALLVPSVPTRHGRLPVDVVVWNGATVNPDPASGEWRWSVTAGEPIAEGNATSPLAAMDAARRAVSNDLPTDPGAFLWTQSAAGLETYRWSGNVRTDGTL